MYPRVFSNKKIGKLKNYQVHLEIDSSVNPVQQKARRVPYHLMEGARTELKRLEADDVIEKVDKAPKWISPMIVVPKKRPGEVRVTLDSRIPNKATKRMKYEIPTLEELAHDIAADISGDEIEMTKIDCDKAFHQLELDEESRDITTMVTTDVLYRYKRLHMGINCAPEIFQHVIQNEVLVGLKGVRNMADDILVWGKPSPEHDQRLQEVCQRLREKGLTAKLRPETTGVSELVYYGVKFSRHGVAPEDGMTKALREAEAPENYA